MHMLEKMEQIFSLRRRKFKSYLFLFQKGSNSDVSNLIRIQMKYRIFLLFSCIILRTQLCAIVLLYNKYVGFEIGNTKKKELNELPCSVFLYSSVEIFEDFKYHDSSLFEIGIN